MTHPSVDILEARVAALEARLVPRRPAWSRRRRLGLAFAALALAIAAPAAVLASHLFTDVPTSSTFHTTISNIKQAGLTSGCAPNKYCPADPVRRDSMSSFLNRGLGRGAAQGFGEEDISIGLPTVAQTTLAVPGAGWILVQVDASAHTEDTSGCPCEITVEIKGPGLSNSLTLADRLDNAVTGTITYAHLGTQHLFAVPAAGNHTFSVKMGRFTGTATVKADGELTAIWIPFGPHGEAYFGDEPQ